jgi:hypothetical protein
MSNTSVTASVSFIDLATFGELEGFIYGGPNAITWFVASVQKGNWFSQVPISLRNVGTTAQFGAQKATFSLSRQGDYVLSTFLRCRFPAIGFKSGLPTILGGPTVRFVNNLMHNLVRHCQIEFNELVVQEFDNYWLDDNFEWRCPGNKRVGYLNMIGMVPQYITPVLPGSSIGGGFLSLPLPFFFGEDSGIALPVAALPFNDIKITYDFRDWTELVMVDPKTGAFTVSDLCTYINGVASNNTVPALSNVETFAHYAIVHNDERVKMGDAPRDILIHQIQETQVAPFKDVTSRSSFDIRLSHAIVLFTYKAMNNSLQARFNGSLGADWSNYTTQSSVLANGVVPPPVSSPPADPIAYTNLFYENSVRLSYFSDYFSLTHPWYFSDAIAEETGYHIYSYALKPWDATRPSGSTDYSKLANVSIAHDSSTAAVAAAAGNYADGTAMNWPTLQSAAMIQSFQHVFCARNWNILRVANGSAGFPAL